MARTINGNLRGKAARITLDERLLWTAISFKEQYTSALSKLQELDHDGWEKWYDAQPEQTCGGMLPLIEQRIVYLQNAVNHMEFDINAGVDVDAFLLLMAVLDCPPEPETLAEAISAAEIGAPEDWPWTEEDQEDLRGLYAYGI